MRTQSNANSETLKRKIDWLLVMEGIYGSETETDESGQTEEAQEEPEDKDARP